MKHPFIHGIKDLAGIPEIAALTEDADYIALKVIESDDPLETLLSKMFSYRPALVRMLYRLRAPVVRLLGFKQPALPEMSDWIPDEFPMLPCGSVWFFTVKNVEKDRFWIAGCPRDRHLDAEMAVVAETPGKRKRNRFHILTVVRYKHWTGPVYFNLIRSFSKILVSRMARTALQG